MSHANAALTPRGRARLARLVVDEGWTAAEAAKMFMVSSVTALPGGHSRDREQVGSGQVGPPQSR